MMCATPSRVPQGRFVQDMAKFIVMNDLTPMHFQFHVSIIALLHHVIPITVSTSPLLAFSLLFFLLTQSPSARCCSAPIAICITSGLY